MKGFILSLVLVLGFISSAYAGFEGRNDDALVGVYNRINCGTGVECTGNTKGIFNISTAGSLENQVTISASPTTITESQCGSTFLNSTNPVLVNLPEASTVIGCRYHFVTSTATYFDINPDDDDQILITTDATGNAIRNTTLGNNITLQAIDATNWITVSSTGSYIDID